MNSFEKQSRLIRIVSWNSLLIQVQRADMLGSGGEIKQDQPSGCKSLDHHGVTDRMKVLTDTSYLICSMYQRWAVVSSNIFSYKIILGSIHIRP